MYRTGLLMADTLTVRLAFSLAERYFSPAMGRIGEKWQKMERNSQMCLF
jgi:hypothetical protein